MITAQDMYKMVGGCTKGTAKPKIYHTKRKGYYYVIGFIKIDTDGTWHQYIQYEDIVTHQVYARHAQCFKNFKLVN